MTVRSIQTQSGAFPKEFSCFAEPTISVIDLGCGIRPQKIVPCQYHFCVDPYLPYLKKLVLVDGLSLVHMDALSFLSLCGNSSAGVVCVLDLIEHLQKENGFALIEEMKRVARRSVILYTPLGFLTQVGDAWGLGGDFWQEHRSGWLPENFPDWHTAVCRKLPGEKHGAFWAIWNRDEK